MEKALLSVALAGFIVMSGITVSQQMDEEFFDIVVPENKLDLYPNGSSWSTFGNTENFQTGTNYTLEIVDSNEVTATFESDVFNKSDRILLERILVDVADAGTQERKLMYVQYHNEKGNIIDSQNITLERGYRSYEVDDPLNDYYGYSYRLVIDTGSSKDNTPIFHSVSFDYTLFNDITDGIPIDLSQIILWLSIIMGMVIAFVGMVSGALDE